MSGRRAMRGEQRAHSFARDQGVRPELYALVRVLAIAGLRFWFRVRFTGREHIPTQGAAILTPNHKNFLDAFFIGLATRRHVRYMAKVELFRGPLAWLLPRLGAFPVRRGATDAQAIETARAVLSGGGLVVVFPEGTRVAQTDALGSPHHGAGRLSLETGAPIVPAAITGTAHLWRGAIPRLRRVQIAFLAPVAPEGAPTPGDPLSLIDDRVWPAVRAEYGRLRATPGMIAAGLGTLGIGGGLLAKRQLNARRQPRLLGKIAPRNVRSGRRHKGRRLRRR